MLLVSDQQRDVLPTVCVKTGEKTDGAIRLRAVDSSRAELLTILIGQAATVGAMHALRRPVATVALPVSIESWRLWRARLKTSVAVSAIGAAFAVVGALRGISALVALGVIALAAGWLNRVRSWHNAWVGVRFRAGRGEFVVSRVHSTFDIEAKALYSRAMVAKSKRPGR